MNRANTLLGGLSVDEFMSKHWQRRPLLVRGAFPAFVPPVSPARLLELATHDDAEARLVTAFGKRWSLARGPFEPDDLPPLTRKKWTVLVQGVDTLDDDAHALLRDFRFVPDARLDDLMISFATDGGGVGPHLDNYDVFLIQAHGRRRWRIGPPCPDEFIPGMPVKILKTFEPDREWILEPGDMLYLPPMWAHEGTAVGDCMTYSVGFRAPTRHEFLRAFLADEADSTPEGPDTCYADRGLRPARAAARIPAELDTLLGNWLLKWRPSPARVHDFIGRYVTEPKPNVWFDAPSRVPSAASFLARVQRVGVRLDRRTRAAYRGARLFVNGESFVMKRDDAALFRALADERVLAAEALSSRTVDDALMCQLREWFAAGWLSYSTKS